MKSTNHAFELCRDLEGFPDGETYDAILNKFPGHLELWLSLIPPDSARFPSEVWFWASLDRVKQFDLLCTDVQWVVCSRRLLEALRAVGPFPHAAIPAHFREVDQGDDATLEGDFFVLVITEPTDALDYDACEFAYEDDGAVDWVEAWAFKQPPSGLPPVFKVAEDKGPLLVSAPAAAVITKGPFAGIELVPQHRIGGL